MAAAKISLERYPKKETRLMTITMVLIVNNGINNDDESNSDIINKKYK